MRLRTLTALAALSALTACAPLSGKKLDLSVSPKRCGPDQTAEVKEAPRVPDGAGFPAPMTEVERGAVALYTSWLAAFGQDNADKTERLKRIRTSCLKP